MPSGRWCPTSAGPPPGTGASWLPHPAARPAWSPSVPPQPWADSGLAAGLEEVRREQKEKKEHHFYILYRFVIYLSVSCLFETFSYSSIPQSSAVVHKLLKIRQRATLLHWLLCFLITVLTCITCCQKYSQQHQMGTQQKMNIRA